MSFRLLTYIDGDAPRAGVLVGDTVYAADKVLASAGLADAKTTLGILQEWDRALPLLESLGGGGAPGGVPLAGVKLTAPILYPGAFFCAAANYYKHSKEMDPRRNVTREGKRPYFFLKPAIHTTIGPNDPVPIPDVTQELDWEIELAVVIGRTCHRVTQAEALNYVAGYTIVNDLSARDLAKRDDWQFVSDWFGQKVFDASMPMGPWITPASEIPDPQDVTLNLWLNDVLQQHSKTDDMLFSVAEQIEYVSARVTLRPGDVIATGTPGGVGKPRGLFLKPGDMIRVEIEGIGSMENPVVALEKKELAA